jgi:hypothetical protein
MKHDLYLIEFANGFSTRVLHKSLVGAKLDATERSSYDAGDYKLTNLCTGEVWTRKQFRNLNTWGYERWIKQGE